MIISVSGKIGSGKSHVAKYLKRKLRFKIIDAEKIMHEIIQEPELQGKLIKTFGPHILHPNGTIDRNKLILNIGQDMLRLEIFSEYVDPLIRERLKQIVEEEENNYILESTTPIKHGLNSLSDVNILVVTIKRVAYQRLLRKFNKKVIDNLWIWQNNTKKYDFLIENKSSIGALKDDIEELIGEMFKQN